VNARIQEFPPFRLDLGNQCLWRIRTDGIDERLSLTPKAFSVLRCLVDHAGSLVTEDQLLSAAWPDVCVQPEAIKAKIYEIRKILEDKPKSPRFIETLSKRGYMFIARVGNETRSPRVTVGAASLKVVGQDNQIRELKGCLQQALAGQRQIVFIAGENGVGKAALTDQFIRRVMTEISDRGIAHRQFFDGNKSPEPYSPILEAIGDLRRGCDGASLVQILSAQASTWLVQFPELVGNEQRARSRQENRGDARDRMLREIGEALERLL
jgi:DNA-binding winged helix-turn-helix (wHTH) protein